MKFGIREQLVLLVTGPIVLVSLSIGAFLVSYQIGSITNNLDTRASELMQDLIRSSELSFYSGDTTSLKVLGDQTLVKMDVLAVEFLGASKEVLVRSGIPEESYERTTQYKAAVYQPKGVTVEPFAEQQASSVPGQPLGYVVLTLSLENKTHLTGSIIQRGVLITFLLVIVGGGFGFWIGYRISARLGNITAAVAKLHKGEYRTRCREDAVGEMKALQEGINKMAETIEKNEINLREKIAYSTGALKITVHELREKNKQLLNAKAKAVKHERERVIVEERERIMQDMHDGIGGQLVASLAIVENYENSGVDVERAYEQIRGLLRDCLDDLRMVIDSLDNSTDKLAVMLGMFRHRMQKRIEAAGIKLKWDIASLPDYLAFSPHENLHILRIIQEAITNVIKHANATSLMFSAVLIKNEVRISICDNGTSGKPGNNKGRGVANMKRRATELSGHLTISQLESGRQIELFLPVKQDLVLVKETA